MDLYTVYFLFNLVSLIFHKQQDTVDSKNR